MPMQRTMDPQHMVNDQRGCDLLARRDGDGDDEHACTPEA
jgi:hypothetical protein